MNSRWISALFLFLLTQFAAAQKLSIAVNGKNSSVEHSIFVSVGDAVSLRACNSGGSVTPDSMVWVRVVPAPGMYDNTKLKDRYSFQKIFYKIIPIRKAILDDSLLLVTDSIGPGTFYLGIMPEKRSKEKVIKSCLPLHLQTELNLVQIVCRSNNEYWSFLSELFNTPFILDPTVIPSLGHQTDLRMGSDCAEFLIYGKRRQGFNIPYCGPKGIVNYLDPVYRDSLYNGCIIHFGEQVALLYDDCGIKGKLDDEDILLQCYERGPELIAVKKSEFRNHSYKTFKWKRQYEKPAESEPATK
jgi:hypothetical protein